MSKESNGDGGFVSLPVSRDLSEDDKDKLNKQDLVSTFKVNKLELEARKNWDKFYHRNKDNFFKDRNWSTQDMRDLCPEVDFTVPGLVYLEAGCGVGNMMFPFAANFPHLRLKGFDFSANAVSILENRATSLSVDVETAVVDLSVISEDTSFTEPSDVATLIFVMSAIHPEKFGVAAKNMRKYLKIGGSLIVRDYGINDYAMIRFGRASKLGERFYVRQDGTRAYYFEIDELVSCFELYGFKCERKEYLHRQTVNHQKSLQVPRIFVQAKFVKVE